MIHLAALTFSLIFQTNTVATNGVPPIASTPLEFGEPSFICEVNQLDSDGDFRKLELVPVKSEPKKYVIRWSRTPGGYWGGGAKYSNEILTNPMLCVNGSARGRPLLIDCDNMNNAENPPYSDIYDGLIVRDILETKISGKDENRIPIVMDTHTFKIEISSPILAMEKYNGLRDKEHMYMDTKVGTASFYFPIDSCKSSW